MNWLNSSVLNSILQRESIVREITDILTSFDDKCRNLTFKKGIFIYGSPGCGKTEFTCQLLTQLGYDIIKYDAGDVRNKALIDTITCNNVSNRNVLHMMNRQKKPLAIVMDEIDEMNNGDKRGITSLIKLIRQKKTKKQKLEHVTLNPIVCIGNYYVDKKMKELKKVCNVFELKTPTRDQMSQILDQLLAKGVKSDHPVPEPDPSDPSERLRPEVRTILLDFIQGDMRKLCFIQNIYQKRPHFLDDPSVLADIFQIKTYNDDAKKITHRLLNNYVPLEQHNQILNETDRTIVSLLYHENVVDPLWAKSPFHESPDMPRRVIRFYNRMLDNLCFADHIDRITFQNQIWIFNEMSSMIKTFYNNWLYHQSFPELQGQFQPDEVRFTKVLTKYSTEYNNQVFLFNMCQELDMDRKDVVAFFQELRLLLDMDVGIDDDTKNRKETGLGPVSESETKPRKAPLSSAKTSTIFDQLDDLFQATDINRLDIKRMYRFLDKNSDTFDLIGGKKVSVATMAQMEELEEDDGLYGRDDKDDELT